MEACAYCEKERAVHRDHILSRALRRKHPGWDDVTVPSCGTCNWLKGTRRLVPPSWEHRIPELEELSGKRWAVYRGGATPKEVLR